MRQIAAKIKPAAGFSYFIHIVLTCLLPATVFVAVRLNFVQIAVAILLLSKWRMFAVKPRHWAANIRVNAVDLIFGISVLICMANVDSQMVQLIWALVYGFWLLVIKPLDSVFGVSLQALLSQALGLTALFIAWGDAPVVVLVFGAWAITYNCARHFFAVFEESMSRYLGGVWAYFSAALVWISCHWLLFYGPVAQPALLLSVLGSGIGGIYFLEKTDRVSVLLRRQIVFIMIAIVVIVLTFSDWSGKL
jgi:hypothetical protein